jgi:hypothetical protein
MTAFCVADGRIWAWGGEYSCFGLVSDHEDLRSYRQLGDNGLSVDRRKARGGPEASVAELNFWNWMGVGTTRLSLCSHHIPLPFLPSSCTLCSPGLSAPCLSPKSLRKTCTAVAGARESWNQEQDIERLKRVSKFKPPRRQGSLFEETHLNLIASRMCLNTRRKSQMRRTCQSAERVEIGRMVQIASVCRLTFHSQFSASYLYTAGI